MSLSPLLWAVLHTSSVPSVFLCLAQCQGDEFNPSQLLRAVLPRCCPWHPHPSTPSPEHSLFSRRSERAAGPRAPSALPGGSRCRGQLTSVLHATMAPVSLQPHSGDSQAKDFTRVLPFQLSVSILGKAALISPWFPRGSGRVCSGDFSSAELSLYLPRAAGSQIPGCVLCCERPLGAPGPAAPGGAAVPGLSAQEPPAAPGGAPGLLPAFCTLKTGGFAAAQAVKRKFLYQRLRPTSAFKNGFYRIKMNLEC